MGHRLERGTVNHRFSARDDGTAVHLKKTAVTSPYGAGKPETEIRVLPTIGLEKRLKNRHAEPAADAEFLCRTVASANTEGEPSSVLVCAHGEVTATGRISIFIASASSRKATTCTQNLSSSRLG